MVERGATSHTKLTERLGHEFTRRELLTEALTHPSTGHGGGKQQNYERLEFLGDRVLSLVIAELLFEQFAGESEGDLARRHSALVRRETLFGVGKALGIGDALRIGPGEADNELRSGQSVVADATEAVIAAIYLDGGIAAARKFIVRNWTPVMDETPHPPRDAKTTLQEWAQSHGLPLPQYEEAARNGPPHKPIFTVELRLTGQQAVRASAGSKRAAEQLAAKKLLREMGMAGQ